MATIHNLRTTAATSGELKNVDPQSKPRVLIVEDDRDFANTLLTMLTLEEYEVELAYNSRDAQRSLVSFGADVVLIDVRLGQGSGIDLITSLKRLRQDVLCVVMTVFATADTAIAALKEGAYDYLCKPFHADELVATLDRCSERIDLTRANAAAATALSQAHGRLEIGVAESTSLLHQASHDSLTGLVNRVEFEHRMQKLLDSAKCESVQHALCYMDLDQFKTINDTYGHVVGDELLRQLGQLLRGWIRKQDTLARLGGDEFGVLLERCSLESARRVADCLRNVVENSRFFWDGQSFHIGMSIGIVAISEMSKSIPTVLGAAHAVCYEAKDKGGKRIHVTHEDDVEVVRRHGEMLWISRIQSALEQNRFRLDLQEIVPLKQVEKVGKFYELLLRMEDEQGDIVMPDTLFSAADRFGISSKIDRWVVETALKWLGDHPFHLDDLYLCSINLSGHSLGDEAFLEFVNRVFDETQIQREKICFEITESAAIANFAGATRFINTLSSSGCRFALDGFGSGLSSFSYLRNLLVSFLKIDGTLVKQIIDDPIDLSLVESINRIAKVMGKRTIAKSVENDQILERVREIGIDYAQGYRVSVPRPIAEAISPGEF